MAAPMKKVVGGKVAKAIVKKKAKSAPAPAKKVEEKAAVVEEKEEKKPVEVAAKEGGKKKAAKPKGKAGKAQAKADAKKKGEAQAVPKAGAKAQKKTKALRLVEAQAAVDGVDAEGKPVKAPPSGEPRGVVYVGHIPAGFYEPQMKKYFNQFGKVTRLRHSRSKKNGGSKGYAWVEFAEEAVAKIAQQTMNGYLLFGKKLTCEMVPPEKQHPALFKNHNKKMINMTGMRRKKFREAYNNRPTVEVDGVTLPRQTTRQQARRGKVQKKLSKLLGDLEVKFDLESVFDGVGEGEDIDFDEAPKKGMKRAADKPAGKKAKKAKTAKKA